MSATSIIVSTAPPASAAIGNKHVEDFLKYYIKHSVPPGYAVLLKGKWGSGKTWFLNNFIDSNELRSRIILVSLYGVKSFKEIEAEFFRQLHPVLSKKGMMLAGRVIKGLLKGGLKVDLNPDTEASIDPVLPDINLPDYLTNTKNSVLVFDDVERCSIPILHLLGYVNQFVEQGGYKAILVANEDEIANNVARRIRSSEASEAGEREQESMFLKSGTGFDGERTEYDRVKEKLIGKTFIIRAEPDAAISSFMNLVQDSCSRRLLESNKENICSIYHSSKSENLRHVRQMLMDVDRLIPKLDQKVLGEAGLMSHFICLYLIYSTEIRNGKIKASNIVGSFHARLTSALFKKHKPASAPDPFVTVVEQYAQFPLDEILLPPDLWGRLLEDGQEVYSEINEALLNSSYFQSLTRPTWMQLWHHDNLTDIEVTDLVAKLGEEFRTFCSDDIGDVRHMFGLLLMFSKMKICPDTPKTILGLGKKYVDQIRAREMLPLDQRQAFGHFDMGAHRGLGYAGSDIKEFRQLTEYLRDEIKKALEESRPAQALQLLEDTVKDANNFVLGVTVTNSGKNQFYDVPILRYMKPQDFFAAICNFNGKSLSAVGTALEERYRNQQFLEPLLEERKFLKRVVALLKPEVARRSRTLSGNNLGKLLAIIEKQHILLNSHFVAKAGGASRKT